MSDKKEFNQIKYVNKYAKEHYKNFCAQIKPDLWEDIDSYCKDLNISKSEFLRRAIRALKNS